jgi:hypothetical protein
MKKTDLWLSGVWCACFDWASLLASKKILFFVGILKATAKKRRIRIQGSGFVIQCTDQGCGSVFIFFRIRIQSLMLEANTDPDPNLDPDPIRIQGFNDQKLKKNYS